MTYLILFTISWPLFAAFKVIYDTRGACFASPDVTTDNEKMLRAVPRVRFFDWPSRMHSIENCRAETREYWVLCLKIVQMFYKKKESEHVNFTLAFLANGLSGVILYFVVRDAFGPEVGIFISLLYSTAIWAYQIIFVIGHVHLAQMFFLLAVRLMQVATESGSAIGLGLYLAAGMLTVISFGASSASRKFPVLALFAFLYSLRAFMVFPWQSEYYVVGNFLVPALFACVLILGRILIWIARKPIAFVISRLTGKGSHGVFLDLVANRVLVFGVSLAFLCTLFADLYSALPIFAAYLGGALIIACHLLFPPSQLMTNIRRYNDWLSSTWRSHFHAYPDQAKTFGRTLPEGFRGIGFPWLYRVFWRTVPVVYILYIASLILIAFDAFTSSAFEHPAFACLYILTIVLISLLPVITSELSKSLQVGKAYFPSFIGFLFMVAMGFSTAIRLSAGNPMLQKLTIIIAALAVIAQGSLSVNKYFRDVLPARMSATRLRNALRKRGISEFYTYDNPYNDSFVRTMVYSYPGEFSVKYIERLSDVRSGIIVVPGTSSKSESMESQQYSILNGDFRADPDLNALLDDRAIERIAIEKIRTRGCSNLFVLETEVTGFRDLILGQVKDYDYWIANGWILEAESVHEFLSSHKK